MERIKVDLNIQSSDEILESMYQDYLSCPAAMKYLRNLGLTDEIVRENIAKIYDFIRDMKYCSKCPGVDECKKENPLLCTRVTYEHGFLDRKIIPCKKFLERVEFQNQFIVRDFDDELLDKSIKDIDKRESRDVALNKYMNYTKSKYNEWIYLSGTGNTGRSFLASIFALDSAKRKNGPIIYANCIKRIGELLDLYFKDKEEFKKQIELYSNVPFLVLDDFGNEVKNDIVRDAIIFPILSTRASKKLFTIITSDFSVDDVITLYSLNKAGEIRAKQIGRLIKTASGKEINLGSISIY